MVNAKYSIAPGFFFRKFSFCIENVQRLIQNSVACWNFWHLISFPTTFHPHLSRSIHIFRVAEKVLQATEFRIGLCISKSRLLYYLQFKLGYGVNQTDPRPSTRGASRAGACHIRTHHIVISTALYHLPYKLDVHGNFMIFSCVISQRHPMPLVCPQWTNWLLGCERAWHEGEPVRR